MNKNSIDTKIKNAFDGIHADESLISNTTDFINSKRKKQKSHTFRLAPMVASLIILCGLFFFGYRLYSTPVTVLSVDVNPSLEIGINRFDIVVSVKGFNDDGKQLADEIKIQHKNYKEAIKTINEAFKEDNDISITVAGEDGKHKNKVISEVEKFTKENENASCDQATQKEVDEAHEKGFSFGKYKAYLRLKEEGVDVTEEEIKDMSMKEINEKRQNHHGNKGENKGEENPNNDSPNTPQDENKNEHGNKGENKPNQNGHNK